MTDSNLKYRDHGGRPSQDDDPLMELSRIIGFDEPVKDTASQVADDLSFDLEQELIGGLEAELHTEVRPDDQPTAAPAMHHNWSTPRHVEEPRAEETEAGNTGAFSSPSQSDDDEFDFSASLESELGLSMGEPDVADPAMEDFSLDDDAFAAGSRDHVSHAVADEGEAYSSAPALDSEEYSGDFSAAQEIAQENDGYDPTIYEPAYDPADDAPAAVASYVAAPSLEDELEMLLTGGDEVSQSAAPAAGYPAPQAEPAAVHYPYYPSRSYSSPAPIPGEHSASYAATYSQDASGAHEDYGAPSDEAPSDEAMADEMMVADAAPNGWDGEEPQLDEDFFGAEDDGQYAEAEVPDLNDTDNAQSAQAMVYAGHSGYRIAAGGPAPEVETVTVSESKVDQTDALDLPEVDYEAEPAANGGLNALESEFAEVFTSIEVDDQTPAPETQTPAGNSFDDIFNDAYGVHSEAYGVQPSQTAAPAVYAAGAAAAVSGYMAERAPQAAPQPAHSNASPDMSSGTSNDYYNHWAGSGQSQEDFDYDPHSADDLDIPAAAYERQPARGRRGLVMASVAGAALLIGGLGYYAFSSGGGIATPVVIQADNQPVKVQPENPGGNTVPNQDKAVYDRVAGTTPDAPEQKTLVSTEEKPVDIGMADDDDGSFDDTAVNDRVEPSTLNGVVSNGGGENPVFAPRRVQTMIVKPDGTIVAQEAAPSPPASANVATPQTRPAGTEIAALEDTAALPAENNAADATEPTQTAGIPTQQNSTPVANAPARVVNTQAITPDSALAKPKNIPVVPSRPAQQPVTIVDSTPAASAQRTQVASAANAAGTAAAASAGAYSIQIASQPSADAAQQSYTNLARRYGNIIGGHGVDIRRADIAGKGTYYRVRINAGSKSDAVDLCTRYKSAGGSCFVTQ